MSKRTSSDIPAARAILRELRRYETTRHIWRELDEALRLMTRKSPVRRAAGKPIVITPAKRKKIRTLARTYPDMTMHEIAERTFGRGEHANIGRVSEVLNGRR